MSIISHNLHKLARPRNLLFNWLHSFDACGKENARSLHPFAVKPSTIPDKPVQNYLFDTLSGMHFTLKPLLGKLIRLSMLPEEEVEAYISDIAAAATLREIFDAIDNYSQLTRYLRQLATPLPAGDESDVQKCELMMYGNLECNLKCPYCNSLKARTKADRGEAPRLMPKETARQGVRFIAERTAGRARQISVNFSLGWEPLLSFDRYRQMRDYCMKVSAVTGIPIMLSLNTNGTTFTEEFIEYCEANGVAMAVSIDGPREIHNSMRVFKSGKGSYDAIAESLTRILGSECPGLSHAVGGAVLTALIPHPREVYQHLIELGFWMVVVTPVRDRPDREWSLNARTVDAFKQGYAGVRGMDGGSPRGGGRQRLRTHERARLFRQIPDSRHPPNEECIPVRGGAKQFRGGRGWRSVSLRQLHRHGGVSAGRCFQWLGFGETKGFSQEYNGGRKTDLP